jgi:hypothetical protein
MGGGLDAEPATDATPHALGLPQVSLLRSAVPTPSSGAIRVPFDLARQDEGVFRATVHDVLGRRVRLVLDGPLVAGYHLIEWDGHDARGRRAADGVYFLRVEGPRFGRTTRMVLVERTR